MSDIPIGVLGGDETEDEDNGTVVTAVHGYDDNSVFDTDYNNIHHDNRNRWHIQSHWNSKPEGGATDVFYIDSSNFRIEHTSENQYACKFDAPDPTESDMENNDDERFPVEDAFEVVVESVPYIGTGVAIITQTFGGGGSFDANEYEYYDWHIPHDSAGLPTSQDDAVGVQFDVKSFVDGSASKQDFDVEVDHTYVRHDGYSPLFRNTGAMTVNPYYYPLDSK